MPDLFSYIRAAMIPTLFFTIVWLSIGLTAFGWLHWMFKAQQQPFWRSDLKTDLTYWFLGPLPYGYVALVAQTYAVDYAHLDRIASAVMAPLANKPISIQIAIILLLTDLLQYWGHRLFHQNPLWRFHCIHHAPTQVDWLTSTRIHPINFVLYSTLISLIISLLGFSPKVFFFLVPFNTLFAFLVHANLNWTFGPLGYAIASPVFHRWHHSHLDQGGNKNFAPTFPFLDLAFGTFYMPKGQLPFIFGTPYNNVPNNFLGQLRYPFKSHKPMLRDEDPHATNPIRAEGPVANPGTLHNNS